MEKMSESYENTVPSDIRSSEWHFPTSRELTLFAALVISAVISLGQVSLSLHSAKNITLLVCLLYVLTTLVYQNRYSAGLEKGKKSEKYKGAYAYYDSLRKKVLESPSIAELSDFCTRYSANELRHYREGLLAEIPMSYEEYEQKYSLLTLREIKKKHRLSARALSVIAKCRRARLIHMSKNMLLMSDGDLCTREYIGLLSSKEKQSRDYKINMLSRIALTTLSGAVAVSFFAEPTLSTLVQWCVRMMPVISAAFMGYSGGYNNATENSCAYLRAQSLRLCEFLKER